MLNTIFRRFFALCITTIVFLFSCSSDDNKDDSNNTNNIFVELPTDDLGVYEGILFSETINNGDTFVTLIRSGDKTYDINFNDDIPSITDIQFIAAPDSVPNNVFTTIEEALNNRGIAVNLIDNEGSRSLTITNKIGDSTITFTGRKQQ